MASPLLRLSLLIAGLVGSGAFAAGCFLDQDPSDNPSSGSPYTDEDAGTGYRFDLSREDLASGIVQPGHFHPDNYLAVNIHGRDSKWQVTDCRTCHGMDLKGGPVGAGGPGTTIAPNSCDSCHVAGWRTDCTYCHGTPGGMGNPPRDLDNTYDPTQITFPAHVAHTSGRITQPLDCIQCHRKPTDVLTPYHAFDASPRRGENNLTGGLSTIGVYDPVAGQCTNLYCHGNGRGSSGTVNKKQAGPMQCSSCHADMTSTMKWTTMSGQHPRHFTNDAMADCSTCHAGTSAGNPNAISDKTLHLNGKPDVAFSADAQGMSYNAAAKRCTGTCHNELHDGRTW